MRGGGGSDDDDDAAREHRVVVCKVRHPTTVIIVSITNTLRGAPKQIGVKTESTPRGRLTQQTKQTEESAPGW